MRILKIAMGAKFRTHLTGCTYEEGICAKALIDSNHIIGQPILTTDGYATAYISGIGASGFQLLGDLVQKELESSRWYRFKEKAFDASAFVIGGLVTAAIGMFMSRFGQ